MNIEKTPDVRDAVQLRPIDKTYPREAKESDYKNIVKDELGSIKSMPLESLRARNDERLRNLHSKPDASDSPSTYLIRNKEDGNRREAEVDDELKNKYPESEGYTIEKEVYLRDKDGNIVRDPVTGEARRIDFVVIKDGKVVDSIEVTSKTAPKDEQTAKENRIRENG
ncbi:MAG: hypothetical protein LBH92_00595, partial [Bacteroidales bacterium]|nr:hypothetical protein [Bacteroidales bacterium]